MNENTTTQSNSPERTVLTVRVASPEAVFDELEQRFTSLDAEERPEPLYEVVLQTEADVSRLLRPNNLKLIRTIARDEPASIRETARLVDRDVRQIHDALTRLEEMNLLRFETEGRAKRPVVWYDEIEVELQITDENGTPAPA